MTKRIAVINDLSGFGRCSLTAAISVLSAMGVSPCPFPTAILSAQTGYPSYFCDDYTDRMDAIRQEWEKMQVRFDGIYTGYMAREEQLVHILQFLDSFRNKDNFLLVDPVLGDGGKPYKIFTPGLCSMMKELIMQADYITPNLTELCLLTDSDYNDFRGLHEPAAIQKRICEIAEPLLRHGPGNIIVTGIRFWNDDARTPQIGNLYLRDDYCRLFAFPYVGGSFSGTGDLFASVLSGGLARGDRMEDLIRLAGSFIECAMKDSIKENVPRNDGANYERYLHMLLPDTLAKQTNFSSL